MNIDRLTPGSRAATGQVAQDAAEVARSQPVPSSSSAERSPREDRFELSDAARARQAEAAERQAEVESAREALGTLADLSPERIAHLRERVASGFYDRAEVIDAVAEKIANEAKRGGESGTAGA